MDTYFTLEIDKYFAHRILPDTWHTSHGLDEARFYKFVRALDHYQYPNRLDEVSLREKILSAVQRNHSFNREAAEQIVRQRVGDARTILDFLSETTRFPDPDIEAWEPPLR